MKHLHNIPHFFDRLGRCHICGGQPVAPVDFGPALVTICKPCWWDVHAKIYEVLEQLKIEASLDKVEGAKR